MILLYYILIGLACIFILATIVVISYESIRLSFLIFDILQVQHPMVSFVEKFLTVFGGFKNGK